jgi:alkaline phosphatase
MRYRVLLFLIVGGLATNAWAQRELRIIPPTGAIFVPGQRFDVRLEADELQGPPRQFSIEINGRDEKRELFGNEEFTTFPPPTPITRGARPRPGVNGGVTRRNWSFERPGKYEITATLTQADGQKLTAKSTIEIQAIQPIATTRAKNIILFVGDGMGPAQRTAARVASKGMENGKAKGLLEMDQMETFGIVMTSSLDALVTDSSPGAGAWSTGNKSDNNWHGVYPDNNNTVAVALPTTLDRNPEMVPPFMDNPRVENIAEYLQRTHRMSTGVVTTVAVTDSTPGAFSSHAHRYAQTAIAEQMLSSGHSVILGGGARYFLPEKSPILKNIPSSRVDKKNVVEDFKKAGYTFAATSTELKAAARSDKILGLFHGTDMASRYDRMRALQGINAAKEAVGDFKDQPTLEFMTQVALNVLSRDSDGFFLMVEGGSIDRELHRLDPARALYETIELDKSIGVARAWAAERGNEDTLILVTSDHETAGLAIIGVNENGRPSGRAFPTYEDKNFDGFPDSLRPDLAMTFDYASVIIIPNSPDPRRIPRYYDLPRNLLDLNPTTTLEPPAGGLSNHSAVDVPIGARGPGASLFNGTMDNTEIFFRMLRALKEK